MVLIGVSYAVMRQGVVAEGGNTPRRAPAHPDNRT